MKKTIIFVFALLIFACVYAVADGLAITPTRIEILVDRNGVAQAFFLVTNNYADVAEVDVTVADWNSYKGNGNLDINSWLKISHPHISLEPGETKKVMIDVEASNSMVGSVSGQVSFSMRPPKTGGVTLKMSYPVYVTIRGTEKINYDISKVTVDGGDGRDITIQMFFENRGNVHLRPSGKIKVYDSKKNLVYTADVPENFPVYAGMTSSFASFGTIPASLKLAPGMYTAKIVMTARDKKAKKKVKFRIRTDNSVIY